VTTMASSSMYRSQARRIRARLADRPRAMHQALRALNQQAEPRPAARVSRAVADVAAPIGAQEQFLQLVFDHLDGSLLRYSVRTRLIRQAERMGIGRFDANLLIATAQHRRRKMVPTAEATDAGPRRWAVVASAVAVQGAILVSAWWLIWA
jgi:hypothetical protein